MQMRRLPASLGAWLQERRSPCGLPKVPFQDSFSPLLSLSILEGREEKQKAEKEHELAIEWN